MAIFHYLLLLTTTNPKLRFYSFCFFSWLKSLLHFHTQRTYWKQIANYQTGLSLLIIVESSLH